MGNGLISDWHDLQCFFLYLKKKGYGDKKLRREIFSYFGGTRFMNDEDLLRIKEREED